MIILVRLNFSIAIEIFSIYVWAANRKRGVVKKELKVEKYIGKLSKVSQKMVSVY